MPAARLLHQLLHAVLHLLWPPAEPELPRDGSPAAPSLSSMPEASLIRTRIVCERCLTPAQNRANGGPHTGWSEWWLREAGPDGAFVRVELPRGNQPVDVTVDLSPGQYLLGVGRRPHGSLRRRIDVPSGSCP